jgi:hypothetical protein
MQAATDTLQNLINHAVAHVEKGDKAFEKSEGHYKAAGIYIKQCKDRYKLETSLTWPQFCKGNFGFGDRRADRLIQIGDGRVTLQEMREKSQRDDRKYRAKKKSDSSESDFRCTASAPPKPDDDEGAAPKQSQPTLQMMWDEAQLSERAAVLARMALSDLLATLPPALRARFYATSKAAPSAKTPPEEPFLKASEVLRRALSLLKNPSETNVNEALVAMNMLNAVLAGADIDDVTIIKKRAKAKRCAA